MRKRDGDESASASDGGRAAQDGGDTGETQEKRSEKLCNRGADSLHVDGSGLFILPHRAASTCVIRWTL
jgi:hypothetical protein